MTPWRPAVTQQPETFEFTGRGQFLVVTAGRNACRLNISNRQITQEIGDRSTTVEPYNLRLPRWTSPEPPIVDAHPFFVMHLMATGQVDFEELMEHLFTKQHGRNTRSTLAIKRPCALQRMMGRQQFGLRLMTSNDLRTAQD